MRNIYALTNKSMAKNKLGPLFTSVQEVFITNLNSQGTLNHAKLLQRMADILVLENSFREE